MPKIKPTLPPELVINCCNALPKALKKLAPGVLTSSAAFGFCNGSGASVRGAGGDPFGYPLAACDAAFAAPLAPGGSDPGTIPSSVFNHDDPLPEFGAGNVGGVE